MRVIARLRGPLALRFAGGGALLVTAWVSLWGHLWSFERVDAHRFTARAILSGSFRLRSMLSLIELDEQVHDGAAYTNWGFGVPLLQAPFHAFASAVGLLHGFFPDRAIYFFYSAAAILALWAASDRLLADSAPPGTSPEERGLLAWAVAWLALLLALFPLTATRFIVYEETIAYFVVFELIALSAYVFAQRCWSYSSVVVMGLAAGVALLVRPTGLLYAGLWALVVARGGSMKKWLAFAAALAPCAGLWLYTNHVRSGSYLGLGYDNSTPTWDFIALERFGSRCSDTPEHVLSGAARLFAGFFLLATPRASDAWLYACGFRFEQRWPVVPFFGPVVLAVTCAMAYRLLARREQRLELWAPYALIAVLFGLFVRRGMGFAWRYVGDFWPAILLAVAQHVRARSHAPARLSTGLQAKIVLSCGALAAVAILYPAPVPEVILPTETAAMEQRFEASRWQRDAPLPSRLACADPRAPIYQNGQGWGPSCSVYTSTNVVLGVAPKQGDQYLLRAKTEGMSAPTLRVYVNGTVYVARREGDSYASEVTIRHDRLASPAVVVTVEWTREFLPPPGKLLWIELV